MIFKFDQGGWIPPLASYTPVIVSDKRVPTTTQETSSKSDGGLSNKEIFSMIKDRFNGLPSDQQAVMAKLAPIFAPTNIWDPSTTASTESKYLQALNAMANLDFNLNQYDKAYEIARANNSLNEAAITTTGQVYCVNITDKNDYKLMTPQQLKNQSKYIPITNQDLLYLRANIPTMAFNNQLTSTVSTSTSMKQITDTIKATIANLGNSSQDTTTYATAPSGTVITGMQTIKQLLESQTGQIDPTLQDLYKHNEKSSDQLKQAQHALKWLYRQLPENQKALIMLKTDNGTGEEAIQLMYELVAASLSDSMTSDWSLVGGPTFKAISKQSNAGKVTDNTEMKSNFLTNVMLGQGAAQRELITLDVGEGSQLNVFGDFYNQIQTEKDNTPITNTSMADMLAKSGLQRITKNLHAITFGDKKVSMEQLNNISYNNTGCVRANLPVNQDGTVKLEVLDNFNNAMNEIKLAGDNKAMIKSIISKYKLDSYIDSNGNTNPKTCAPFIVTEGYTNENVVKADGSKFIKKVDLNEDQIQLINDSINSTRDKKAAKFNIDEWFTDTYKAAIYIPITNNLNVGLQNQNVDQDETDSLETKYQNFNRMVGAKTTSADVL